MSDGKVMRYHLISQEKIGEMISKLEIDIENIPLLIDQGVNYSQDCLMTQLIFEDIIKFLNYEKFKHQREFVSFQMSDVIEYPNEYKVDPHSMTYKELWNFVSRWDFPKEEFFERYEIESNNYYMENGLTNLISKNKYWIS